MSHPAFDGHGIGPRFFVLLLVAGSLIAIAHPAQAQAYSVLYNFCSKPNCTDGYYSAGNLVLDKSGNLYGTTELGGTGPDCNSFFKGCGTVFELTPARPGSYTVLYSFTGDPDGGFPATLMFDPKGNLFGTTLFGGTSDSGTVFELASGGTEKVLYSFTGGADGFFPEGPLVSDPNGNLYGTTAAGGPYDCFEGGGCGTVFEVSPDGTETTLYAFTGAADDGQPYGGVVRDAEGNLYGTTAQSEDLGPQPGTVFKLTPSGVEMQLYSFLGGKDGSGPEAAVSMDSKGNLWGTTYYGGKEACYDLLENGCGVVFKVTKSGKETVRHKFTGGKDGAYPTSGLIEDAQGNLYGTTYYGGSGTCTGQANGCGVIFKIPKKGKEVVLYTFTGGSDGAYPSASLVLDAEGNLYGTTLYGGANGNGVVFKVTP